MHQDQEDIIVNIPFIIHMIFEMAFANFVTKMYHYFAPRNFYMVFRGVFEAILFVFSKNHVFFYGILINCHYWMKIR